MNIFDNLQNNLFDTVTSTMGYDATWLPSTGGDVQVARVLYNGPTEKEKLFSASFDPEKLDMEYKLGDFGGLKALADDNETQTVTITDIGEFSVRSVEQKFDGKTFIAHLQRV